MKRNKFLTILLSFALLLPAACKIKRPDNLIPEDKMKDILTDYHMAKAISNDLPYNESYKKEAYKNYVFMKHGITESEFDSSLVWYARNTKEIELIYEDIEKRISSRLSTVDNIMRQRENKFLKKSSSDSTDIWGGAKFYFLGTMPNNSLLFFSEDIDTTFHRRDEIKFKANFDFIKGNENQKAIASISLLYRNDSIANFSKDITKSGFDSIQFVTSDKQDINKLYLSIYLTNDYTETKDSMSLYIKDFSFMRYRYNDKPKTKVQ